MTKKQAQEQEKQEAIARLRDWLKPGDTVYTINRHTSSSGMSRVLSTVILKDGTDLHPNHAVATACRMPLVAKNGHDGIRIGGCGMDMGFALVYELSHTIYPEYACPGDDCPSPEHAHNRRRQTCNCGHEHYNHTVTAREGWHTEYGACEVDGCTCQAFQKIENVDHRGPGVMHRDGYALRHRWL